MASIYIFETISKLLTPGASLPDSATITEALLASEEERASLEAEKADTHAKAIDPLVPVKEAEVATARIAAIDLRVARLANAEAQLRGVLAAALEAEAVASLNKSVAAAREAVFDVHDKFLKKYPHLVLELVALLKEIREVRSFVGKVNEELAARGLERLELPIPIGVTAPRLHEVELDRERVSLLVSEDNGRQIPDAVIERATPLNDNSGRLRLAYRDELTWGKFASYKEFDLVTYKPAAPGKRAVDILDKINIPGRWYRGEPVQKLRAGEPIPSFADPGRYAPDPLAVDLTDSRVPATRLEPVQDVELVEPVEPEIVEPETA